jgi:hypothetical protein
VDDLVLFVPDPKKTPALRAGTVNPASPYRFALPPKFREGKVANILSGNYCQVRYVTNSNCNSSKRQCSSSSGSQQQQQQQRAKGLMSADVWGFFHSCSCL